VGLPGLPNMSQTLPRLPPRADFKRRWVESIRFEPGKRESTVKLIRSASSLGRRWHRIAYVRLRRYPAASSPPERKKAYAAARVVPNSPASVRGMPILMLKFAGRTLAVALAINWVEIGLGSVARLSAGDLPTGFFIVQ